jgi:hypothetical protein
LGVSFAKHSEAMIQATAEASVEGYGKLFEPAKARSALKKSLVASPQAAVVKREKPKLLSNDAALRGVRYTASQM